MMVYLVRKAFDTAVLVGLKFTINTDSPAARVMPVGKVYSTPLARLQVFVVAAGSYNCTELPPVLRISTNSLVLSSTMFVPCAMSGGWNMISLMTTGPTLG